jgi:hypothetical protein
MTTLHFHTTVPADCTITLPPEFCGDLVDVIVRRESTPLPLPNEGGFRKKKSLDEIIAEQGGPRTCTNPTSLSEGFPKLWDNEAELKEFLERRQC